MMIDWLIVPKWYDSHLATLNDTEAVFERFFVVAYRAFPAELRVQSVGFAAANLWAFDDDSELNQVF
ncbi:hypothetical protein AB6K47_004842, partial [Escherichia coli]|nr:hypothetical protein [Salmonella enterica]EHI0834972.1 hypothetical protein [Escherichia coli]EHJ5441394.1 hypothetical protein [Escherichia coli]EHK8452388.1 hypothetical protein [Escherichia coli]EHV2977177.1 hypothetical protein [Escherichia coli]